MVGSEDMGDNSKWGAEYGQWVQQGSSKAPTEVPSAQPGRIQGAWMGELVAQAGGSGIRSSSLTRHRRRARPAAMAGVRDR